MGAKMEEEAQVQVEEQEQVNSEDQANQQDQQTTPNIEELLAKQEEKYKRELAGLNKTVTKLQKDKETLELEKMSESERAEAEKRKAIEEAESIKAETAKLIRERDLTKVLFNSDLDPDLFADRIKGETFEEMEADANVLAETINKAVEAKMEKEITRRLGGVKPEPGEQRATLSVEDKIERARKISNGRIRY
jgi:flagellar biosynthesis GTPase FlhF